MRTIRKLFFQNAKGQRWGLNGELGVYASNLSGFGQTLGASFSNLGRGFFAVANDELEPQAPLAFTLTFTRNPYEIYAQLVDWLAAAGTVAIIYSPTGAQQYCRDVTLNFMQKSELSRVGWLEVPSSFLCMTPWYLPVPSKMALVSETDLSIKRYTYQYTPDLMYGSDGNSAISGTVQRSGHIPAALELTYYGAIENPVIRLVGKMSGKTHGVCSVRESFGETEALKFSSRYRNSFVRKVYSNGQEQDLLDVVDLGTNPFFRVPADEPCVISIESEVAISGRAELLIYYYFRSV